MDATTLCAHLSCALRGGGGLCVLALSWLRCELSFWPAFGHALGPGWSSVLIDQLAGNHKPPPLWGLLVVGHLLWCNG